MSEINNIPATVAFGSNGCGDFFREVGWKGNADGIIMRCDSDSGKKLIKSMVLRTADRQGMC